MFVEPYLHLPNQRGWIEVICGSMFSGKTEELIRRINRALIAKQSVSLFKPALDVRYDEQKIVSHNQNSLQSRALRKAFDILDHCGNSHVVGIDEAQFFDDELLEVAIQLANQGIRVIISGLDMDFEGKPFGIMPQLMSVAEFVTKVHAICAVCGGVASYSYRLSDSHEQILLGEKDLYEPRCRACFLAGQRQEKEKKFEFAAYKN